MISVQVIVDKNLKSQITLDIMNSLPEWFSPPEDIILKSKTHRDYPFFAALDDNNIIGFVTLKIHNEFTADIYTIGVRKEYHRCGAGGELVKACEQYCKEKGYLFLTVKTLDESADYEPYNLTRAFYRKSGFIPLEVFKTFWNEENPCLFLAKYLG